MTDEGRDEGGGPVPVRDLMRSPRPTRSPEAEGTPRWESEDRAFETDGVGWIGRPAGVGAYGTGDRGTARILAVHFYRQGSASPEREALVAASRFPHLREEELGALLNEATPIEMDTNKHKD